MPVEVLIDGESLGEVESTDVDQRIDEVDPPAVLHWDGDEKGTGWLKVRDSTVYNFDLNEENPFKIEFSETGEETVMGTVKDKHVIVLKKV